MAQANSGEFMTPEGVLAFSSGLFELQSQDGKKFNYGCTIIFDNKHKEFFLEKVRLVVGLKWGDKGQMRFDKGMIKSPLLDGEGKSAHNQQTGDLYAGFGPGKFFIRPNAQEDAKPRVFWKSRHIDATKEEVYSGCRGVAVLNAYSWENATGGHGVSFGLRAFRKTADGESLGGRAPFNPDKWFVDLEDDQPTDGKSRPSESIDIFS
jgi:hypothetical protein